MSHKRCNNLMVSRFLIPSNLAATLILCILGLTQYGVILAHESAIGGFLSTVSSEPARSEEPHSPQESEKNSSKAAPSSPTETNTLTLTKVFHVVGIPGLKRNGRCDLTLTTRDLNFQYGKNQNLLIPFEKIRRVELVSGDRHYAKSTFGAAVAAGIGGDFLILKKRKVDTLVLEYLNERGGLMGLVVQVPEGKGPVCKDWLTRFGLPVEIQKPTSTALPANK